MKQLIIARHAKSSRDDLLVSDRDRGLSKRGKRDLIIVGDRLQNQHILPELIFFSPAKRTKKTTLWYAKTLGVEKKEMVQKENLYLADLEKLIEIIEAIPQKVQRCMLVGHNPGLTELANRCGYKTTNIPTCGIAIFSYTGKCRRNFEQKKCLLKNFISPKMFKDI